MDMLQQDPHLAKAINRRDNVLRRARDNASWWKNKAHNLQEELGEAKKKYGKLQEELDIAKARLGSLGSMNEGLQKQQRRM
jgi:chromosome segregation ATPase